MKRGHLIPFVIFIPTLVVQLTLVPLISVEYFVPDLVLILLVYYTLLKGQMFGTITGAVFGLLFDLFSGNLLGLAMFSKTIAGFTAGYFYNENKIDTNTSMLNFSLIVFLSAFVDSFFNGIFSGSQSVGILFIVFERSLFPALYTAVLALLIIIALPKRRLQ